MLVPTDHLYFEPVSQELIANLKDRLRDARNDYHRSELLKRTLLRLAIIDMSSAGYSRAQICQLLGCGAATVQKWRQRVNRAGGIDPILHRLEKKKPGPCH